MLLISLAHILSDLPILFPYPRIYPGKGLKYAEHGAVLTYNRAICVRLYVSVCRRDVPANEKLVSDTCATSKVSC